MKKIILISAIFLFMSSVIFAQTSPKVKWFFTPELSGMIHQNHTGLTMGAQLGASLLEERLQVGFFYYGRSGPINPFTETITPNEPYKGQSSLEVRADHASFGLMVSPQFKLSERVTLDIPLMFGSLGAGFFLTDEDRITPDGRRVSEWENELMNNMDAGFGLMAEAGVRVRTELRDGISAGIGLHYSQSFGWETFVGGTNYYNVPRVSVFFLFGN